MLFLDLSILLFNLVIGAARANSTDVAIGVADVSVLGQTI